MKKRILILGAKGQLGSEFIDHGFSNNTIYEWIAVDRKKFDFEKLTHDSFEKLINQLKPDLVINCVAYTNVDQAENNAKLAMKINGYNLGIIAQVLLRKYIPIVHFSTEYVFGDNKKKPLTTSSIKSPICKYGESKLLGEELLLNETDKDSKFVLIVRLSWVFGSKGNNFVKTILKLGNQKELISVVDDQIGGPTNANSIADFIINLIPYMISNNCLDNNSTSSFPWGIYHFQSKPEISWFDFATKISVIAKKRSLINKNFSINSIKSSNFQTIAKRQLNSRLDCLKTEETFNVRMPNLDEELSKFFENFEKKYF